MESDRINMGVEEVLRAFKNRGYNPSKGMKPDTRYEFKMRLSSLIATLAWKIDSPEVASQTTLDIVVRRRRFDPSVTLRSLFRKKLSPVSRRDVLDPSKVAEFTLVIAGALLIRGFRNVGDKHFLDKLKHEIEWYILEMGYLLSSAKVHSCPFVVLWHEYPIWLRLCRADGLSEGAADQIVKYQRRRRTGVVGCSGYSCGSSCQVSLVMSA